MQVQGGQQSAVVKEKEVNVARPRLLCQGLEDMKCEGENSAL